MQHVEVVRILILAGACLAAGAAAAQSVPAALGEIVVTAPHAPDEQPINQILAPEINAYGVGSVTDLLQALEPQTRSSMSDLPPIVLINGRIAGTGELDNLPPEAILRVDVLPESSSLRYGFPDTQRVLNFVLRDHYRGLTAEASDNETTEGGGESGAADVSAVRVEHDAESAVRLDYKEAERLLESQRDVVDTDPPLRTLVPSTNEAKLSGSIVRPLLNLRPSLEASVDLKSANSLQGLATDEVSGNAALLRQHTGTTTTHLAARAGGALGFLSWSSSAGYDGTVTHTRGGTGLDAAGELLLDHSDSSVSSGSFAGYLGGPVAQLPAGAVLLNINLASQWQTISTSTALTGVAASASRLSRSTGSVQLNGNLPLTSREQGVLPFLGDFNFRFDAKLQEVSEFGLLPSYDLGVTWKPLRGIHVHAEYSRTESAPSLQDLLGPSIVTPGVQLFDFVTGETVYVTEIAGGDDDLRRTDTRVASFGVYLGPFVNSTGFGARFEHRRVVDAAGPLPAITAEVQDAFPDRFLRDASGTLFEVDDRSVNLALEAQDDLKWGFNVSLPISKDPPAEGETGLRLWISAYDTWYFRDTILLRAGVPPLDLLDGAPLSVAGTSVAGSQSRHALEYRTTLRYHAFGARLRVRWRSATLVDGGTAASSSNLYFSDLTTADLRVYADLAQGLNLNLGVTNLFDSRQTVQDGSGVTPVGFQPGYVDPLGRVITVGVRKVW